MGDKIGVQIRCVSNRIKATIDKTTQGEDVTGMQSYLLGYLAMESAKKDVYQKDVEKYMHISKASVTSLLQQLEKKNCIRRESVEGDARLKRILVTQKGSDICLRIADNLEMIEEAMHKNISEQELRIFFSVLRQIKENLARTCEEITEKGE